MSLKVVRQIGLPAADVIRECIDAGWQGIKLQSVLNRRAANRAVLPVPRSWPPVGGGQQTKNITLTQQLTDRDWAKH